MLGPQVAASVFVLPPHVKVTKVAYHYESQEKCCYYCNHMGHFAQKCPERLKGEKEKGNLSPKQALKQGAW